MSLNLEAVVVLNKGGFNAGLSGMSALVRNTAGAMAFAFGGVTGELFIMVKAFGAVGAAVFALKQAISIGESFEFQMANVATVTNLLADEFASVTKEARRFAETTSFTANESATALYSLASAGFAAADSLIDMLTPALTLAGATQSKTQVATETLTIALNAFQLETSESMRVANLFAGAISNSPATMDRLSEAVGQASPVAAAFNVSLESMVESLAAFHKVGLMGSEAGTAFRQAMTQLTLKSQDADSVLGKALKDWKPAIEGLTGAIIKMEAAGISGADAMKILGIRGGKAVAAQLALGGDAIKVLGAQIKKTGDVTKMYSIQMDTVRSQWKVFLSMMQENGLRIWDQIKDRVMAVIKALQESITTVREWSKAIAAGKGLDLLKQEFEKVWPEIIKIMKDGMVKIAEVLQDVNKVLEGVDWNAVGRDIGDKLVEAFVIAGAILNNYLQSDFATEINENIGRVVGGIIGGIARSSFAVGNSLEENGAIINKTMVGMILGWQKQIIALIDGFMTALVGRSDWVDVLVNGLTIMGGTIVLKVEEIGKVVADKVFDILDKIIATALFATADLASRFGLKSLADKVDETSDRMSKAFENTLSLLDKEIAGSKTALETLKKSFSDMGEESGKQSRAIGNEWPESMQKFLEALGIMVTDTNRGFGQITNAAGEVVSTLDDVREKYGEIRDEQGNLITSTDELAKQLGAIGGQAVTLDVKSPKGALFDSNVSRIADALDELVGLKGILWA